MSTTAIDTLKDVPLVLTEDFKSSVQMQDQILTLALIGSADLRVMAGMEGMLAAVEQQASSHQVKEVVVDLRELEFMNSSCLKTFVSWLGRVQEYEPARQYPIRFKSSPTKHWQARSLAALSCFAVDLVRIDA